MHYLCIFIVSLMRRLFFKKVVCGNKYTFYIWVFFRKFRVVSVFFGLLRNSSVCFGCFDTGSKHRNKPKQTRNRSCFGLFRFEPKFIFVCFEDTLYVLYSSCFVMFTISPTDFVNTNELAILFPAKPRKQDKPSYFTMPCNQP
jgi:hypothetical protein